MKNGPLFFLGLFSALGISWAGLVIGINTQLGGLSPYFDEAQEAAFPARIPGIAEQGLRVYRDLGCASCHTQQVRRPGFGADQARGWGERQSVARDYIYQSQPQLGTMRIGPDLANYGTRAEEAGRTPAAVLADLYNGHAGMPAYRFLFAQRKLDGEPSAKALVGGAPAGYELVPTARAEALVAYLLSLKQSYDLPEAMPYEPADSTKEAAQ
ncbi:MAG: cbb3-type cytochrome c oxidase subunit II [Opitutaceae bacterium]|nr:cbb3-type cytochrome c oxidase subunit II [Opitutaceae bacterium]